MVNNSSRILNNSARIVNNGARMVNTNSKYPITLIGGFLAMFGVIIFLIIVVVVPLINRKSGFINQNEVNESADPNDSFEGSMAEEEAKYNL